ncbi:MAG: hypothetical protein MK213_02960, partial [Planctomycetes bacterium]|nr:hypothetical protein [Planctomycetota bacterium]
MKLNPQLKNASPLALGFTLAEVLLASALTMVLMFGALYGTSESYEVARSGDRRVHTHISARRALDRLLKDCRYADDVALGGNPQSGYSITIDATSELDPEILTYFWSPSTKEVTVTDGATTDLVLSGVQTV